MKTIRTALKMAGITDSSVSIRDLARSLALNPPVSLSTLSEDLKPKEKIFLDNIITPAGTPLGGSVNIKFRRDGSYTFSCNMHDSGIPDFDFLVRAIFVASNGVIFVFQHSGHVEGTISTVPFVHEPKRDDDYTEDGSNAFISLHWPEIINGQFFLTKEYSATGAIGFIEDVTKALLDIGAGSIGFAVGVIIGLGSEIGKAFGDLGIGGTFGIIAGVVVFAFGGSLVLATIAGVAVGLVTNAMIKQRPLRIEEINVAQEVFSGSLSFDKITLTNLAGLGGRAFTMPGVDGRTYVNLGNAFDNPLNTVSGAYPNMGQLLIHELTHAWQIEHRTFLPGFVCEGVVNQTNSTLGQSVYQYPQPGRLWSAFNLEQQGAIVDQWYGGTVTPVVPNRSAKNPNDPYFVYIRDNIRTGQA